MLGRSDVFNTAMVLHDDGGYEHRMKSEGEHQLYRFAHPKKSSFPKMIEPEVLYALVHDGIYVLTMTMAAHIIRLIPEPFYFWLSVP